MMSFRPLWLLALLLPSLALAELKVVATSSSTGMLVREIGAEQVSLEILAPPDRDLHHLQARPSMMRALRSADLVTAIGAELEVGWLPVAITQAANPRILPGRPGYFEAAAQVDLLDVGGVADRALGDVHPGGNPHLNLDPVRMAEVGQALATRLAALDPANAETYRARAEDFARRVAARMATWAATLAQPVGVVSFHRDVVYLLDRFGIPHLGTLEPVPGVPPTASHIGGLVDALGGSDGVVVRAIYQPPQAAERVAGALGWSTVALPLEPPLDADGDAYLAHIGQWVDALAAAAR
jgi:zinc/manganese transport system substrate-binding protein